MKRSLRWWEESSLKLSSWVLLTESTLNKDPVVARCIEICAQREYILGMCLNRVYFVDLVSLLHALMRNFYALKYVFKSKFFVFHVFSALYFLWDYRNKFFSWSSTTPAAHLDAALPLLSRLKCFAVEISVHSFESVHLIIRKHWFRFHFKFFY